MELSSEVPGTSKDWPSDITIAINGREIDTWTAPADYGDKRGKHTPVWWKLAGSQYGDLKQWRVTKKGTYRDGAKVSKCSLADLELERHRSIRIRIGVKEDARHPGGHQHLRQRFRQPQQGHRPSTCRRLDVIRHP